MLRVSDLHVFYGQIEALRGLDFEVHQGEIISIIGANGAGKSTLMWTLAGVLKPKTGTVTYQGAPLPLRPHEVLGKGLCLVPERRRLYATLTVKENLIMGAFLRHDRAEIARDMEQMLVLFPVLRQRLKQYAGTLSGGEQQMLAIARGLMSRPNLLLLDEPSLGLAPLIAETVFNTVLDIRRQGTTVLLAEQNAFKSLEVADRAYVLESGKITLSGTGKDLLDSPAVQEAYLGMRHDGRA